MEAVVTAVVAAGVAEALVVVFYYDSEYGHCKIRHKGTVALLAWVPWVPGNPSILKRTD